MRFFSKSLSFAIAAATIAGIAELDGAVKYIEPNHTTELFALEHIPLPRHSMQDLANALLVAAQRKHDGSATHQQATGRLLLLAMQLEPHNKRAFDISKALASGKSFPAPAGQLLQKSLLEVDAYQLLLSKPEAGEQANMLALYIEDIRSALRPGAAHRKDTTDWQGTLPALNGYQVISLPPQKTPAPKKESKPVESKPTPPKKPAPVKPLAPGFYLASQSILMPVIVLETSETTGERPGEEGEDAEEVQIESTSLAVITLKINPCKPEELAARFISMENTDMEMPILDALLKDCIFKRHSKLPPVRGLVSFSDINAFYDDKLRLAAPLALLLEASIKNTPLRKDLCFLANIEKNGKVTEPEHFWQDLAKLRQASTGGRLIVSAESAEIMQQVLVYEEPDFFTRWEVFTATDIEEALAAAAQKSPPDILKATELFTSIQNIAMENDVAPLVTGRAVRERLREIEELAPGHLSAAMLLLQGGGKRPMHLNERVLALELRPIITELRDVMVAQAEQTDIETLEKTHEQAREALDTLLPLIEPGDNEFYEDTLDLTKNFRKLASAYKRIEKRSNNQSATDKAAELFTEMQAQSEALTELANELQKRPTTDEAIEQE
ncbi:MAG: hypothetical protein ACPH9O_07980 [Akkermansiaceae bacterium]